MVLLVSLLSPPVPSPSDLREGALLLSLEFHSSLPSRGMAARRAALPSYDHGKTSTRTVMLLCPQPLRRVLRLRCSLLHSVLSTPVSSSARSPPDGLTSFGVNGKLSFSFRKMREGGREERDEAREGRAGATDAAAVAAADDVAYGSLSRH